MFSGMDFELREYVQAHVINEAATLAALLDVLIDAGLITEEEFRRRRLNWVSQCEQEYQAMKDERTKT